MTRIAHPLGPQILETIREGLESGRGGEVVIRSDDQVSRIYLYGGAIAWVVCGQNKARLSDVLASDAGITADDLNLVLEEARTTGANFAEMLLSWGLTDRETLRACLQRHNARHLAGICAMPEPMMAMFVPQARTYATDLVFTLDELLAAMPLTEAGGPHLRVVPPAEMDLSSHLTLLETNAPRIPGCRVALLVDLGAGTRLGAWRHPSAGDEIEERAAINAIEFLEGEGVRKIEARGRELGLDGDLQRRFSNEVIAMEGKRIHFIFRGRWTDSLALVVVCEGISSLGMVLGGARGLLDDLEHVEPQ